MSLPKFVDWRKYGITVQAPEPQRVFQKPSTLAEQIVAAGKRARAAEPPDPLPLGSLAAQIVAAAKKARSKTS
jgi:hypothetical protein